jgi:transcriptional regulator of arginine metabolism
MDQRPRRHRRIAELLARREVRSQEALRELLAQEGLEVAQATLSRDLRELGVRKGPGGYELPSSNGNGAGYAPPVVHAPLQRALAAYALSVEAAGSLVVIKTGPGQAQLVAFELDRSPPDGVAGTIAGDDTIFIACRSVAACARLASFLRELAGLPASHGRSDR